MADSISNAVVTVDNLDEFSRMVSMYKAENDRREEQDKKRLKTDKIFLSVYIMGGLYYPFPDPHRLVYRITFK